MTEAYTHHILKVVVAQICQTIGWHSIQSLPLELMVDILDKYLKEITRSTHRYSELYGRTDPNLDDVGLAYKDLNVNLSDLQEYIQYVDPVPCAVEVPKYPVAKDSHLNFLKPGSKEVLTRPVHIHEHLPPINPVVEVDEKMGLEHIEKLDESISSIDGMTSGLMDDNSPQALFKRPTDMNSGDIFSPKRTRLFEEEGRPTREISSVMMTTSGFISPAREGKLPDSKAPVIVSDYKKSPPLIPPTLSSALPVGGLDGKFDKKVKKRIVDKEKKKEKPPKELFKPDKITHHQPTKLETPPLPQTMLPEPPPILPVQPNPPSSLNSKPPLNMSGSSFGDMLLGHQPAMSTPIKKGQNKPHKKKKIPLNNEGSKPENPKPPKRPKQTSSKKQLQKQLFSQMNPQNQNPMMNNQFMPPQYMDLFAGKSVPLNSQTNIMPALPPFSENQMHPLPPFNNPYNPNPNHMHNGKLSTEHDKQKLNIFKKISKPKEPEPPVIVIDDDDQPPPTPDIQPYQPLVHKSQKGKSSKHAHVDKIDKQQHDMPLNMSMSNKSMNMSMNSSLNNSFSFDSGMPGNFPIPEFSPPKTPMAIPKTPDIKLHSSSSSSTSWIGDSLMQKSTGNSDPTPPGLDAFQFAKETKKKRTKTKDKEKKVKNTHGWNDMNPFPPFNNADMKQQVEANANLSKFLPPYIQQAANANKNFNMFNMFPLASGPGLIPNNQLFSQMNHFNIPNVGFGVNPLDINNFLRYPMRKPDLVEPEEKISNTPPLIEKSVCNVAPLLPASLKLEHTPNKTAFLDSGIQHVPIMPPAKKLKLDDNKMSIQKSAPNSMSLTEPSFYRGDDSPLTMAKNTDIVKIDETIVKPVAQTSPQLQLDEPITLPSSPETTDKNKPDKRKEKEHKKEKKDKEGKMKKKKDKKDKIKSKEKEKEITDIPKKEKKEKKEKSEKEKLKKEKKEKRREKERVAAAVAMASETSNILSLNSESNHHSDSSAASVPKLTLKLGSGSSCSPRPETPDANRKFPSTTFKHDDFHSAMSPLSIPSDNQAESHQRQREPSPELARISALVTRPPKQKNNTQKLKKEDEAKPTGSAQGSSAMSPSIELNKKKDSSSAPSSDATSLSSIVLPSSQTAGTKPTSPVIASQVAPPQGVGTVPATPGRGRPRIHPIGPQTGDVNKTKPQFINTNKSPKETKVKVNAAGIKVSGDTEGNEVWICPACGRVDDGTPMIGCDGCDAWYHWVCVGIQVPPDANEDWYCRVCIGKKQESHGNEKKKKRKKKDKKEH